MRRHFKSEELRLLAVDPSFVTKRWGRDVVRAYRKRIQALASAVDERDLYAMHSLHLERLKGDRKGTSSIRLNDQFRLIIRFTDDGAGRRIDIIEIVDYH